MSYVAHQYSRVNFYSSLEVNLSLYYGGVTYYRIIYKQNPFNIISRAGGSTLNLDGFSVKIIFHII